MDFQKWMSHLAASDDNISWPELPEWLLADREKLAERERATRAARAERRRVSRERHFAADRRYAALKAAATDVSPTLAAVLKLHAPHWDEYDQASVCEGCNWGHRAEGPPLFPCGTYKLIAKSLGALT